MKTNKIMVIPRRMLRHTPAWLTDDRAEHFLNIAELRSFWMNRDKAEESDDVTQLIPCGILHHKGGFRVYQIQDGNRPDLDNRLSMISGGHLDYSGPKTFMENITYTLEKELREEVDIGDQFTYHFQGILFERSVPNHIGVLFLVATHGGEIKSKSYEYTNNAVYNGRLVTPREFIGIYDKLEPWSKTFFKEEMADNA